MKNCIRPAAAWLAGFLILFSGRAWSQALTIQGHVTSQDIPAGVAGVSVTIQGGTAGTVTDAKGNYRLPGVPSSAVLMFSYIGYQEQLMPVNGKTTINVTLKGKVASLNQLVVIGYGTQKKKDLTGAVSSVNVAKMQNQNPTSVQEALRANVPGLNVGFSTGAKPGGSLQVRGQNSLNAGTSPLIVVDGAIYYGELADINPQDIATVDVLKDASAAAVYGAKAASGVIMITTKMGKTGKPTINFNANFALATMEVNQPVYQGQAFIDWRTQVENSSHGFNEKPYEYNDPRKLPSNISQDQWLAYDASSGDPVNVWLTRLNFKPIEITDYKTGQVTNWYDMVFRNGFQQNYTLSLSGGSDKFHYYWSGGYLKNQGIVVGDEYSTVQSRLKLEGDITPYLTVGINTAFSDRDESSVPVDWTLITLNSPYGSMWNPDTTDYRFSPQDDPGAGARNPLYGPEYTDRMSKYFTLNTVAYAKLHLPFGITYTLNFTPEFSWHQYFNDYSAKDQDYALVGGEAMRSHFTVFQWQIDHIINWNKSFGQHHFELTLLANAEKYQYWQDSMYTQGFNPSDALSYHNFAAGSQPVTTSDDEYSTGAALMARLFYSYKDRYMLTVSTRRDGYSAFGQKYPWAMFPAAAAGWVFSEEPFLKGAASWLDFGKLRFSYGVNGNRDIGRYIALADLTTGKYLEVNPDGTTNVVSQLWVGRMQNPNLKWERTAAYNLGLDFSLFKDVVSGSIEAYKSKTTNLLMNRTLPDMEGFANIETNLGEVDNKGLEITVNTRNISRRNFSWTSSFNFSLNRNTIVHLYGNKVNITDSTGKVLGTKEADDISNKWFIGHAIDAVWDAKVTGVYQTSQADQAAVFGKKPGDFIVQDVNGDGTIDNDDRQFLGYSKPRFRWTFSNDFTFLKNFDLSATIYSYWGDLASFNQAKNNASFPDRVNAYVLPYWTPEHPENKFSRIYSNDGGSSYSVYRKRSFIRLDHVALAYTFPKKALDRAHIEDLKLYFNVKNVAFYAPDWDYWDPDWPDGGSPGPTPRTYTLGLNLTL